MSKKGMDLFTEALHNNKKLADDFAKAVAKIARDEGYDVNGQDVKETLIDEQPSTRPLPPNNGSFPSVTLAIGEEDKPSGYGGLTTKAIGEESKPSPRPLPPSEPGGVTTAAVGEEDKKPRPRPPSYGLTTLAIGEEDGWRR